jgi:Xaa-Pro aminopeptidase
MSRVRTAMVDAGVDALLLSVGPDLPWLTGYEAMPLERLTMLVLRGDDIATLVVPVLEAPRVAVDADLFALRPWPETEDPVGVVAALAAGCRRVAIGDRTWSMFLLALQRAMPAVDWTRSSAVTGPLRAVKDALEVAALEAASAAADRVANQLLVGDVPLVGRTEAAVSADLGRRLIAEGHGRVNFAIVGSGPNSASPHHDAGDRRIAPGDPVVCDFGGMMAGYCSDITRTVVAGGVEPDSGFREVYDVVRAAQSQGVAAALVGTSCSDVDAAARRVITDAGYGEWFIHRTGHGIGMEEHEDPYLIEGNAVGLVPGHAFSVEPGIYLRGRYGVRIEDIVIAAESGPRPLNHVDHALTVVDA